MNIMVVVICEGTQSHYPRYLPPSDLLILLHIMVVLMWCEGGL